MKMIIRRATTTGLLGIFFATSVATICSAATFSFERITNNGTENPEAQFSVDVSDSAGRVLFKLSNAGPTDSNVTEVYWDDDDSLLSNGASITPDVDAGSTSAGVTFLPNSSVNPANLPGQNAVSFTTDHRIDSQNGNGNGIEPLEMAGFLFDGDANNVIAAMQAGTLRIGMHVRSIGTAGESEGFVNLVPEPSTVALLVAGMFALAHRLDRR